MRPGQAVAECLLRTYLANLGITMVEELHQLQCCLSQPEVSLVDQGFQAATYLLQFGRHPAIGLGLKDRVQPSFYHIGEPRWHDHERVIFKSDNGSLICRTTFEANLSHASTTHFARDCLPWRLSDHRH